MRPFKTVGGLLPFTFVIFAAWDYYLHSSLYELFWLCNIFNVTLGIGILFKKPSWIWISTLWLIAGIPLWMMSVATEHSFYIHAVFTHFVAAMIGIGALQGGARDPRVWWKALLLGLVIQTVTHVATPEQYNINISFRAYSFVAPYISQFWLYCLLSTTFFAGMLYGIEFALLKWLRTTVQSEAKILAMNLPQSDVST